MTAEGETPTDAVLRELERHDVAGAIVRVRVKICQSQEPYLRTRDIEDALADAHMIAGIVKEIQRETRSRIGLENPESLAPAELLERYLLSKDKPADEIAALMGMANEILKSPGA